MAAAGRPKRDLPGDYEPANAPARLSDQPIGELMARRAKLTGELETAEAEWLKLGEKLEAS